MRKFILICMCILSTSVFAKAPEQQKPTFSDGVSAVHQDLVSTVSTIHQDAKDIVSTVYGDGKDLAKDIYPAVKDAVVAIGSAIGQTAGHVYEVLTMNYVVLGIKEAVIFIFGLILFILGWILTHKFIKTHAGKRMDWPLLYTSGVGLAGIIMLICVDYNQMLMGLINPEWGAINYILEFTKSML